MRYVKIPSSVSLPNTPKPYNWSTFLDEFVWESKEWQADIAALDALVRAHKLADAKEGEIVSLSDADHERVWKLVQAATIPGAVKFSLIPFCAAIGAASSDPPPQPVEQLTGAV